MKHLKKILCFLLIVPFMVLFVSCGNPDDDNDDNGNNSGVPSGKTTLTTSQILKFAYDEFCDDANRQIDGASCFSGKTEDGYTYEMYDKFVYANVKVLDILSSMTNLSQNVWCYGNTAQLAETSLDEYVNEVLRLYIDSSTYNDVVTINLYMLFGISDLNFADNALHHDIYFYQIKYYENVKAITFTSMVEKSRVVTNNFNQQNTVASYYVVNYSSSEIEAYSFKREWTILNTDNLEEFNSRSITGYNYIKFKTSSNSIISKYDEFDILKDSSVQTRVQNVVVNLDEAFEFVTDEEIELKTKIDGLTENLILVVNSAKISDFVED